MSGSSRSAISLRFHASGDQYPISTYLIFLGVDCIFALLFDLEQNVWKIGRSRSNNFIYLNLSLHDAFAPSMAALDEHL